MRTKRLLEVVESQHSSINAQGREIHILAQAVQELRGAVRKEPPSPAIRCSVEAQTETIETITPVTITPERKAFHPGVSAQDTSHTSFPSPISVPARTMSPATAREKPQDELPVVDPVMSTQAITVAPFYPVHLQSSSPISSAPPSPRRMPVTRSVSRFSRQSSIASPPRGRKRPFAPLTQLSFVNPNQYEQTMNPSFAETMLHNLGHPIRLNSIAKRRYLPVEEPFIHPGGGDHVEYNNDTGAMELEQGESDVLSKRLKVSPSVPVSEPNSSMLHESRLPRASEGLGNLYAASLSSKRLSLGRMLETNFKQLELSLSMIVLFPLSATANIFLGSALTTFVHPCYTFYITCSTIAHSLYKMHIEHEWLM